MRLSPRAKLAGLIASLAIHGSALGYAGRTSAPP